jgi:hypothetical protein
MAHAGSDTAGVSRSNRLGYLRFATDVYAGALYCDDSKEKRSPRRASIA